MPGEESTDLSPRLVLPVNEAPAAGLATVNQRVPAPAPAESGTTRRQLEPVPDGAPAPGDPSATARVLEPVREPPAVIFTATQPLGAPAEVPPTAASTSPSAPAAAQPLPPPPAELATSPLGVRVPVNAETRLTLQPVPESGATMRKLEAVPAAPRRRTRWVPATVVLGLVFAGVAGVVALERPQPARVVVVEEPLPAPPAPTVSSPAAGVGQADPTSAPSGPAAGAFGSAEQRKASFYPEKPTNIEKRGIRPDRRPPPRAVLRVVTTAHGNVVPAPLLVDGAPAGQTPKDLRNLKPGVHSFKVEYQDEPPVEVFFPVVAAQRQKNGDYLEIELLDEPSPGSRRASRAEASRPMGPTEEPLGQ